MGSNSTEDGWRTKMGCKIMIEIDCATILWLHRVYADARFRETTDQGNMYYY